MYKFYEMKYLNSRKYVPINDSAFRSFLSPRNLHVYTHAGAKEQFAHEKVGIVACIYMGWPPRIGSHLEEPSSSEIWEDKIS